MTWVFGYGSLVWRPAFPFAERRVAVLEGYARRFWQGSPDHRGTPEAPGRVVTLVASPGTRCTGMAYRLRPEDTEDVLAALDHREQAGYARLDLQVATTSGPVACLTYMATSDNPCFLGPAPLADMAAQIGRCVGPSGPNERYLRELARTLDDLGAPAPHVTALVQALDTIQGR